MDISSIYNDRKEDPQWNTSYPISPSDWKLFRSCNELSFENERQLSFYVHIPFCKQLCRFCVYTRMLCPDVNIQHHYITTLHNDISRFKSKCNGCELKGFDIGGGTPTSLSDENFNYLLDVYDFACKGLALSDDYEPSIEGTFNTLTESKVRRIAQSNIRRISLGIQSSSKVVLSKHQREVNNVSTMEILFDTAWSNGIKKINVDLMYGLDGQDVKTISQDLRTIEILHPQQVTLYELRTNMIGCKIIYNKDNLYNQYMQYYEGLRSLGYYGRIGQNTFSINNEDFGVSSYLRNRMLYATPYKGFGLSAQSMNSYGVAYNIGKNNGSLETLILNSACYEADTYVLPKFELAAKYIAISAYSGKFSLKILSKLLNEDAEVIYDKQLKYCLSNQLLEKENEWVSITPQGFKYYGAVFSLFYSLK